MLFIYNVIRLSNAASSCLQCRTLVTKETSACDKNECYRARNEDENCDQHALRRYHIAIKYSYLPS